MIKIFQSIQVSDKVSGMVDHSFEIANVIHYILEKQGKTQLDLTNLLGKEESEISRRMQGTHNFRLSEIGQIESVLGERLLHSPTLLPSYPVGRSRLICYTQISLEIKSIVIPS